MTVAGPQQEGKVFEVNGLCRNPDSGIVPWLVHCAKLHREARENHSGGPQLCAKSA